MSAPKIWQPANVYPSAKLGQDVSVGMFTEIGHEVVIGDGTRIGAHCFIPEGVVIGKNCFIGPHVCFTNDAYPPSPREDWQKTLVQDGAAIGAAVTVLCGVIIGHDSLIGCGSVVTKSVPPNEIWAGVPAKKLRDKSQPSVPSEPPVPVVEKDLALDELYASAVNYYSERLKQPNKSSFRQWSDACDRLEAAAVRFAISRTS